MCHALLQDIKFFQILVRIDEEFAQQTRTAGCACGGSLHRANYPRKPRGCPAQIRTDFEHRLSFCCNACRKRTTCMSVRFLGRRVYLGLAMVLMSARLTQSSAITTRLSQSLGVSLRTLQRWRQWWQVQFPLSGLWQAMCARFMPPVQTGLLPSSLMQRFGDCAAQPMTQLLVFLSPITVPLFCTQPEGC